jgi:hypothetical protein
MKPWPPGRAGVAGWVRPAAACAQGSEPTRFAVASSIAATPARKASGRAARQQASSDALAFRNGKVHVASHATHFATQIVYAMGCSCPRKALSWRENACMVESKRGSKSQVRGTAAPKSRRIGQVYGSGVTRLTCVG